MAQFGRVQKKHLMSPQHVLEPSEHVYNRLMAGLLCRVMLSGANELIVIVLLDAT